MNKLEQYLNAASRENTVRSYASAIRHFEVEWGGFLPATADSVARYLADYADTLAISTLKLRLAAIAAWHQAQGFPDPTKAPVVKTVLKGIAAIHPAIVKQAVPVQIAQLEQVVAHLEAVYAESDKATALRCQRDKALLLIGFWRGFRGDELKRLQAQFVELVPGQGMTCYLHRSKGDRQLAGRTFRVPALARLCPVAAYEAWIDAAGIASGPVFRGIDRWGRLYDDGLHENSLIPLIRRMFSAAGVLDAEAFSSHSLRRGFANWAVGNGWDLKTLMEYVGWKDVKSAMRYLDSIDPMRSMMALTAAA
ncbi:MAG: site-specific integrase [Chitinimonas sp.]|nr:site-specific integrase [Chitinimonas sp.]